MLASLLVAQTTIGGLPLPAARLLTNHSCSLVLLVRRGIQTMVPLPLTCV